MKEKKRTFSPINVPRWLESTRGALIRAFEEDDNLEKFTVTLDDGHKLTLEELHTWLIAAIEHYEKNGPKAQALKMINELLRTQHHPDHQ